MTTAIETLTAEWEAAADEYEALVAKRNTLMLDRFGNLVVLRDPDIIAQAEALRVEIGRAFARERDAAAAIRAAGIDPFDL